MNDLLTPQRERIIPSGNSNLSMEAFFKQVRELENEMGNLSQLLKKLQDANDEFKAATKVSTMKAIKERMAKDIDEVKKFARRIKTKLDEINEDNAANRQKPGCGDGTGVDRSRVTMTNALKNKLKKRMTDFQILQKNIHDEYHDVVKKRVFTVTGYRPDDETIDKLIDTGNIEQVFHSIREMGKGQVLDTIKEIQERHDAVKEIEKELLNLHQIFLDMVVLVEAQGDLLDNIEAQASKAVDHIQSKDTDLATAKNLQKKFRICMMIAITILLTIAIIIVLATVKPWHKGKS